ncbi:mediator of RNA polymerase II transcription subunit 24-like [Sarcophilus harrisii]
MDYQWAEAAWSRARVWRTWGDSGWLERVGGSDRLTARAGLSSYASSASFGGWANSGESRWGPHSRNQDFTEDVNCAFEFLLKLIPLLDRADQRCNLNEFTKHINGENSKAASVRALLFDISFLMLCHVAQTYRSEVILSESSTVGEVPFFETWMQMCMPEEGKILNPDHPCFRPDSTKVESLVALLNNTSETKLVQILKWHEACLSILAAILEILNAWENGVLAFESIQKITDNIKGKVCSLAVCAIAWLVAHVRMLGLDEREKSLQMIRQLVGPLPS